MKLKINSVIFSTILVTLSCQQVDDLSQSADENQLNFQNPANEVYFEYASTIQVGGEASSEISAFDPTTNKLFVVNVESSEISVFDLANINEPILLNPIALGSGSPNSVAVHSGKLAVAVEAENKQAPGSIKVYDTESQQLLSSFVVGALPDMVTFSPNGKYLVSANEGEPNSDYTVDPDGSVSIITVDSGEVHTLSFESFNDQEEMLKMQGLRIFGPNASFSQDIEPEYVAISDNSNTAWVTLQENNGIARINLNTKQIEGIFPLGFKNHSLGLNSLDASDRDNVKELKTWPVLGMYQPDAIAYAKINGSDLLFTANEGDARDYDGYSEEERVDDLDLDPAIYVPGENYQTEENLGRLKTTSANGDTNRDGLYEQIYSYGARSFSVWSGNGNLLYDSGNEIGNRTLELTPDRFNDNDGRSDDKGAEPESATILELPGKRMILFLGLERNDQVLVYDVSNPMQPQFIQLLSHAGDEAPEGLLVVEAKDSPSGKELVIVSNEDSGTVSIYENKR